jgi:nucleotide-binding universal stress UspA family protein
MIIAATDFSQVGENAVHYACSLALSQRSTIIIIHSFMIPVMFSDIPMPASLITEAQSDAETQMNKLVFEMADTYAGLEIKGKVIYGDIITAVDDYVEENTDPWLVVVGNNISNENASWPDSTLIEAFKKLKYPVLAIPQGAAFKPVSRLCLAFDNKHTGNEGALQHLINIVLHMHVQLLVLNAQGAGQPQPQAGIDEAAKSILAPVNPQYHIETGVKDIDEAIERFSAGNNIDWLVLIPRKHSFFENIFHHSHTKKLALHSVVPILALHEG